jgi:hypothetical protein
MQFLWSLTLIGSLLAGAILFVGLTAAKGAPQEASVAAIALCVAVIPYVFTRAAEGIGQATWRRDVLEEMRRKRAPE